ncbi:twinkle protein, mitochondrial [Cimex lectularius]|uniref:DNA 5'-3' helicase n=1 Tax=Cimex lectularius TaxID=79782 RepID=A0A8I6ST32_CIMLE|nr:twinkle protein, mitochondrial [Cimex lectularius]XP_024085582.1 twinkle protein, mitochondrial [Cimex lectularius]XP_024085583.1 twinkle protein, mitochondrial [Cimex lectularius]
MLKSLNRLKLFGRKAGRLESGLASAGFPVEKRLPTNPEFVSVSQVKQSLIKNRLTFDDGFTCLSLDCFLCAGKSSKLYINKITGFFICHGCNKCGNWVDLEAVVRDKTETFVQHIDNKSAAGLTKWLKIQKHLHHVSELSENRLEDVLRHIGLPNLSYEVLKEFEVHIDIKTGTLYFPLCNGGGQITGYKTLHKNFKEESYPSSDASGILHKKKNLCTSAVVVHSVRDFLGLCHVGISNHDIICLPHGQYSLPQSVLPLFENYKKLILWFGNDTSWDNARQLAKKLSEQRCHLVRPIDDQKTVIEAIEKHKDIQKIINTAQKIAHSSITTFSSLREDVFSELYNADKASGVKWERFPLLNKILKGHRRGELTILTGPTGSGKTTFMSEYSLDLAMQKVTTLWGSFEIRNQRLAKTMLTQMAMAPLEDNVDSFDEWADCFEQLPIYFMTFHGQQALETVMETVKHASYVHDVAHVIIDNVQFMLGLSSSESGYLDRFYRQDVLIGSFRNFATMHNCHVTLVIHPRKEKEGEPLTAMSIFGGAKASQEADNVLIIQNQTNMNVLKTKKFLQISKNRFSGDLGMMPLDFSKESLSFMTKSVKL